MQSWYWLGIYCFGSFWGYTYHTYLDQKDKPEEEQIGTTKFMALLRQRPRRRACTYVVTLVICLISIERGHNSIAHPENMDRKAAAIHAPSYNLLFVVGLNFVTMNMILGRCSMLRFLLLSNSWRSFSGLVPTLNMMGPIVALCYFLSTYAQLSMTFGIQLYYFCGILLLTIVTTIFIGAVSDLPM